MQFEQLGLAEPLLRAVHGAGYSTATPIQARAIPAALSGRDLLGCAQTGTGKTAAFALPILHRLAESGRPGRGVRALIVTPTRELAAQIADSMRTYSRHLRLRGAVVFGGVGQGPQVSALRSGVDVLVATPGRLLDLVEQGHAKLGSVETLVLDEADRMLDMGFAPAIRAILRQVPERRQTLLFSATMPKEIRGMAESLLSDPVEVSVAPQSTTAENVDQRVLMVARENKQALLAHLLQDEAFGKTLVFTRTKHGADRVAQKLARANITAAAIHGNKSQNARLRALDSFKRGKTQVLVASDIAARGLDIDDVSHVINFDLPNEPETYVHRIGRTGRAGNSGTALSFCTDEDLGFLRAIERAVRSTVEIDSDHPYHERLSKLPTAAPAPRPGRPSKRRGRPSGGRAHARPPRRAQGKSRASR